MGDIGINNPIAISDIGLEKAISHRDIGYLQERDFMKKEKEKRRPFLVRFEPEAWVRLKWLHKNASNGLNGESLDRQNKISLADIVNNAVMNYRCDEIAEIAEKKKRLAQEMCALELIEKGLIARKEREKQAELDNAFKAQPEKVIRHAYPELVSSRIIKKK